MSVLLPAFDKVDNLIKDPLVDIPAGRGGGSKQVFYTNVDERSNIEAQSMYILEENVRYVTQPRYEAEPSTQITGTTATGCGPAFDWQDNVIPEQEEMWAIESVEIDAGYVLRMKFKKLHYVNGCLAIIQRDAAEIAWPTISFAVCDGHVYEVPEQATIVDPFV